jgi:DNA replication licensing factor MCM5
LRQFHEGNFQYKYREQLKHHYNIGQYWIEIDLQDCISYDEDLADKLSKHPTEYLPLFEDVAKEVADEVTRPRTDDEPVQDIQVMVSSGAKGGTLRDMKSEYISKLVKVPGIVIAASSMRAKATSISIQCRGCKEVIPNLQINGGLEGFLLPRKCSTDQTGRAVKCPLDPFAILPDKCKCIDFQILKLQEAPEAVPHGEMPRHLQLYCDRYLCEKVVPGNRITVTGVFAIKKISQGSKRNAGGETKSVGIRTPYLRVVGISVETEG